MGAIGLNPIRLDRIGLDPIRINAIKLGVPGAASDRPYIDPEVLASLRAVCICYGKSNDDPDRAVVKNLVDPDNPFVISNAAYKLNSGYGKYEVDFTINSNQNVLAFPNKLVSIAGKNFSSLRKYTELSKDVPSYKVKVTGLMGKIYYWYRYQNGAESRISITKDGIYQLPVSYNVEEGSGFQNGFNGDSESSCTIEQIPSFEGAFVTDGVGDLITSTKTLSEMTTDSDELTVVSMINTFGTSQYVNFISTKNEGNIRRNIINTDNLGIYGFTSTGKDATVINNILGDENGITSGLGTVNSKPVYGVNGYILANGSIGPAIRVAWYWTIIANKVLTADQINQVIAYYNLDRTLKPDILCNVKKQGITNENHAQFGDKLIDFSGNGRDIQLYNFSWKGNSGIGKYEFDFANFEKLYNNVVVTNDKIYLPNDKNKEGTVRDLVLSPYGTQTIDVNSYTVEVKGLISGNLMYYYRQNNGVENALYIDRDGAYTLPKSYKTDGGTGITFGFVLDRHAILNDDGLTITQIPSHEDALCLDGVNDFGKVTGMPIYKDYTVVVDREILSNNANTSIVTKGSNTAVGAFSEEIYGKEVMSFGNKTSVNVNKSRVIFYGSKYLYKSNLNDITALKVGDRIDGENLYLGTFIDNDYRFGNFAFYSLMSFPYSMSEFLIERQLKKHKLGTLYPDMVEFRPVIKSNIKWNTIEIWQGDKSLYRPTINDNKTGIYLEKNSIIGIYVKPKDADEVTKIVVNGTEYTDLNINSNGFYYVTIPITKSPQKIDITIDEYIGIEGNTDDLFNETN